MRQRTDRRHPHRVVGQQPCDRLGHQWRIVSAIAFRIFVFVRRRSRLLRISLIHVRRWIRLLELPGGRSRIVSISFVPLPAVGSAITPVRRHQPWALCPRPTQATPKPPPYLPPVPDLAPQAMAPLAQALAPAPTIPALPLYSSHQAPAAPSLLL